MFERTVTNFSFGKEFFCTGWRLGAGTGPKHLIAPMKEYASKALDRMSIVSELAVGHCLKLATRPYKGFPSYYEWVKNDF